jgi:hypothetical protein
MDRPRRIERTLGCLVVSMTLGAGVLHWFQPARLSDRSAHTMLSALSQPWSVVRIEARHDPESVASRSLHFFVDRQGKSHPTENWSRQKRLDEVPVVRIGLQASPQSNEVTGRQWETTLTLIHDLQARFRIPGQQVIPEDTLAIPRVPTPGLSIGRPALVEGRLNP